jgi:hypothetical protein
MPMLIVQRAEPEGVATKGTKSGKTRRVPLADRVLPIVRELCEGREQDDLLCVTETGHQLHATAFKRTLGWTKIADGRRIHDLRHTAACMWLARGVDPIAVQAWMGHASIATTNLYLHHLGTASDRAGLARLNQAPGCTGGARESETAESQVGDLEEDSSSGLARPPFEAGGAKGTRTPDLLVANETRYRLRHSPADRVGRSAPRLYHRQAEADLRFSSPEAVPAESESESGAGASAVTGPSSRAEDATPGPERSIVRTVRGASGLET